MPPNVSPAEVDERLAAVRRLAEDVELFVAPSAALGAEVVRLGLPAAKVRVSDYGFPPLAPFARTPSPRLRIGFVGTLVWHKGAHVLLEAARSLPKDRYEVLLFGNVDWFPSYVSRLRTLADGLPVRFMGSFGGDPGRVYSQLDVLVVPSLWPENSPLVIHEAFQSGVPVVGADVGGIPELLRDGRGGRTYPATSAPSLAAVLRELVDAPERLEELSRALPAVKDIVEDADFWDGVYRGLA
jgi:glycosyltransferase involved in cell wall biosynthesis